MMENLEQRLSRLITEQIGDTMRRMDEHFIHSGEVQLEQQKQIQRILASISHLNERQGRVEVRLECIEDRQTQMEVRHDSMDQKLDRILELLTPKVES